LVTTLLTTSPAHITPFFSTSLHHPHLHSFPTRRSSDLATKGVAMDSKFPLGDTVITSNAQITLHPEDVLRMQRDLSVARDDGVRSEEHTSELQSLAYLVCRLLLEKKKKINMIVHLLNSY